MSGAEVDLRTTWEFIVNELLAPFDDPKTGYIAYNQGALNYISQNETESTAPTTLTSKIAVEREELTEVTDVKADASEMESESAPTEDKTDAQNEGVEKSVEETAEGSVEESESSDKTTSWWPSFFWSSASTVENADQEEKNLSAAEVTSVPAVAPSSWSITWAVRAFAGDTVELTAAKVVALATMVEHAKEDMKVPLKIEKLFLSDPEESRKVESSLDLNSKGKNSRDVKNPKEIKEIKDKELADILTRIRLLLKYGAEAEAKITNSIEQINEDRQALKKSARSPATADAYLKIWANMWKWVESEASLLHICLAFEAAASTENKGDGSVKRELPEEKLKLLTKRESLEAKFVTYILRTMFMVKLDEVRHGQKEYTGYTRHLPGAEASKLMRKSQETIKNLNTNILLHPGLRRINQFITVIESMQQTVTTAFNSIESTRYSLLSDATAEWLPSRTPSFIASTQNKFLLKMHEDLRGFHKEACGLKTSIELHLDGQETQNARKRLTGTE